MADFTPDMSPGVPIEVSESAIPSHVMSTIRDVIGMGTAWAIGKGYIDAVTGTQIGGIATLILVYIWRQYVTGRTHGKLVATAATSPLARLK